MSISLSEVQADLSAKCPELFAMETARGIEAVGGHAVLGLDGREITRFAVRIAVPGDFPASFPVVFETGYRIPRSAGRHVNPDGSCCIGVPAQLRKRLGKSFRLSSFIAGPLREYFLGQAIVEEGGAWPAGEARHGFDGIIDFWSKTLMLPSLTAIVRLLSYASQGRVPRKNVHCPCGSGMRSRRCHRRRIRELYSTYSPAFLAAEAMQLASVLTPNRR